MKNHTPEEHKGFWSSIKTLFEPTQKVRKILLAITLHDSSVQLLIVGIIFFMQYAVDNVVNQNFQKFFLWLGVMVIMGLAVFLMEVLRKPRLFKIWAMLWNALDQTFMPKLMHGDGRKFDALGTGKIVAIYSRGITTRADIVLIMIGDVFAKFLFFVFFLVNIALKNMWLFVIFVSFIFFAVLIFAKLSRFQFKWRKMAKQKEIEKQRIEVKWIMNKHEIMQQNKIPQELALKESIYLERSAFKKKEKFVQGLIFDGVGFLNVLAVILIVMVSGLQLARGGMSHGELITIVGFATMFVKEVDRMLRSTRMMLDKHIDVLKLQELIADIKSPVDIRVGQELLYKKGDIVIKNIDFSYEKGSIFKNFSLTIPGGTKTAFVGESGGGKTTLIKLLAGYIRPDAGEIEIDGQKLFSSDMKDEDKVSLQSYYKHIGYLTQDPSVFDGTVYENLVYALESEPAVADIEKIIKLAKCEFIREFENGLETEIGERGVRLSGGQKQRLAIAKIMLKNPNIILLDEPTSALDSFNEEQVNIALHNLFQGKTVVVIAHRLQTVKQADRILLFEQGKILEEGTHDQLVQMNGKYKKMLDLQSGF